MNDEALEGVGSHFVVDVIFERALVGTSADRMDGRIVDDVSDQLRLVEEGEAVALGLGVLEGGANAGDGEVVVFLDVELLRLTASQHDVEHAL